MTLALQLLAIVGGFGFLVWGADRFVMGAAGLANNLGVSPLIIGLTIVGFGTSAPEMLVSGVASWNGSPGLSVGNALGSNITNIALVLGVSALISPMTVQSKVVRRELPLLIFVMLFASVLILDGELGMTDGAALLFGLAGMMGWVIREGIVQGRMSEARLTMEDALSDEMEDEIPTDLSNRKATFWIVFGLGILLASSESLVWGATGLARDMGVDELFIGLTVVALGTSLPELAASVAAARRNEHDIALGNVVGSNMFNTLGVLAIPGLLAPHELDPAILRRDVPMMVGTTVLLFAMAGGLGGSKRLGRGRGTLLVALFVGYVGWLAYETMGHA